MSNKITPAEKRRKIKWGKVAFICAMMAYPVFQLIFFWIVPNINSIFAAFQWVKPAIPGRPAHTMVGMKNFAKMFEVLFSENHQLLNSIVNSFWYLFTTVIVGIPLTLLLAYFIYKKIFGFKVFRVIFFLPSIISGVIMATLFKTFIEYDSSPFCLLFAKLAGLEKSDAPDLLNNAHRVATICMYTLWTGFGVNLVMFNSAMSRVPKDVIEYGKLEGVGMTRELLQIITPLMFPTVVTVTVLGLAGFFTFVQPVMLFRPNPKGDTSGASWSIAYYILYFFKEGKNEKNVNYACAVGVFFAVIGTPIIIGIKHLLDKAVQAVEY